MLYYVYIIYSSGNERYYIGISQNVERRLSEHNRGAVKSTRPFIPWILVYKEAAGTRQEARLREKYFKSSAGRKWRKFNVHNKMGD